MIASRPMAPAALLVAFVLLPSALLQAQRTSTTLREFLLRYKGQEVLMMDRTGGVEQFAGGEASKAYTLILDDVMTDYFVVSRNSDSDKRTFLYPLSVIRRIIFMYDGKPYKRIVLEMY